MTTLDLSDVDAGEIPRLLAEVHRRSEVGRIFPLVAGNLDSQTVDVLITGGGFQRNDRSATPAQAGSTERSFHTSQDRSDAHRFGPFGSTEVSVEITRLRTLPDFVAPGMRLLVCGLNPSLHAADAGVGFVSPSNRFWPAAVAAGLVTVDRDPFAALDAGIGMTDIVKRATRRADELAPTEYADGVARLERLCDRLRPAAVCMVGLAGWRAAIDRKATTGRQDRTLGGRPVYVMPSTSGLNAHVQLPDVVEHLRRAALGDP